MKKILAFIMTIMMSFSLVACGGNKSNDQNKKEAKKQMKEDERIVAGSVAVTEMLARLDIKMVGRPSTKYCVSDKVKDLPQIGFPMNPDMERIKALKPDVYVTSGALQEMIGDKLNQNNIKTEFCNLDSYDEVKGTILKLSKRFGKEKNGKKIVKEIEAEESKVLKDINPKKKVKVMVLFGAPGHFMLASKNSFTGSLIEKLGAKNIANQVNIKGQYVPFNLETALKENPDVILRMYHGYIDEAKKQVDDEFKTNAQWRQFKAVKENKVYDLDPKEFGVTGDIKEVEALKKMKEMIYVN